MNRATWFQINRPTVYSRGIIIISRIFKERGWQTIIKSAKHNVPYAQGPGTADPVDLHWVLDAALSGYLSLTLKHSDSILGRGGGGEVAQNVKRARPSCAPRLDPPLHREAHSYCSYDDLYLKLSWQRDIYYRPLILNDSETLLWPCWQKEASDKSEISGKTAKCVCHFHCCQWNIMILYLTCLLIGWAFMHKNWPKAHKVNYKKHW